MHDPNIEETQPTPINDPVGKTQPVKVEAGSLELTQPVIVNPAGVENTAPTPAAPQKAKRWPIILGGILVVLLLAALGAYQGYRAVISDRAQAYHDQSTQLATEQFMLGVQEQNQGHYELAKRHFEYVIQIDPNFPEVKDHLAQVMLAAALARTPTITPEVILPTATIAFTPTPDTRGEEEIFNNARDLLASKEWVKALEVLDTLRNKNIGYRPVEVDDMYYVALRNRGLFYINSGRLESGLYDLALTELFGPLDIDANGLRTWARLYLSGASFWEVRWDKVVEIFAQIYPYYPNLHDINGFTALERYRKGSLGYGDQLARENKPCDAYDQYKNAQEARNDPAVEPTMKAVYDLCHPPTNTPGPTSTHTVTPTPTASQQIPATVEPTTPVVATTEVPPTAAPPTNTVAPTETPSNTPAPSGSHKR